MAALNAALARDSSRGWRRVKKMKLLKGDSFPIFLVSDDVSQQSCRGHLSKEVARSSGCRRSVQRFRCSMAVCTESGPSTRGGSIRSTVRQSHSAKVRLVQLACPECPWRAGANSTAAPANQYCAWRFYPQQCQTGPAPIASEALQRIAGLYAIEKAVSYTHLTLPT